MPERSPRSEVGILRDGRYALATQAVREIGMCGMWSPDGEDICIRDESHLEPHAWDVLPCACGHDHETGSGCRNCSCHLWGRA